MRIGILADIHEDIVSLDLALDVLDGYECDRIVCLGDIVGFTLPFYQYITSRNAEACVDRIRQRCAAAVAGNHDLYAVRKVPTHQAGFEYCPDWYFLDYATRERRARSKVWLYEDNEMPSQLSDDARAFLHSLPEIAQLPIDGDSLLLSHFCHPDFSGSTIHFPEQSAHLARHFEFQRARGCRIGLSGHGHPEGCLIVTESGFNLRPFGCITLSSEVQWIVAPGVARTTRMNGCMMLDTDANQLHVLSLREARASRSRE